MEFLKKHKKAYIIVLSIVCLLAIVLTYMYRTRPTYVESILGYPVTFLQKIVTQSCSYIESKVDFLMRLDEIENENERLKQDLEFYKSENMRLSLMEAENKKLTELLEISQKYAEYPKVGAAIIAKDPGNWYKTFDIDKGSNDGFNKNMVVMTAGGLVGRIIESGHTYSKVISLIDDTFSVSAKSAKTDDIGFVRGDTNLMHDGLCRMDYIDPDAKILEGDEIVTSNLGGTYPAGITIGYVKEVRNNANGLTKYAIIQPTVDFKHLDTVLVITEVPQ